MIKRNSKGQFIKGHNTKHTEEYKKYMSIIMMGNKNSLGKKHSKATRMRISESNKGRIISEYQRKRISEANKGRVLSIETREKIKNSHKGNKSHFWKGGISTYDRKLFLNGRRRALKNNASGSHTQEEWELLKKQFNNICSSCNRSEPEIILTEDHIIPLCKGGSDFIYNIQPLCRRCNCRKHIEVIQYV